MHFNRNFSDVSELCRKAPRSWIEIHFSLGMVKEYAGCLSPGGSTQTSPYLHVAK